MYTNEPQIATPASLTVPAPAYQLGANPAVSANGQIIVFQSPDALTADDTNGTPDLYALDTFSNCFTRLSSVGGAPPAAGQTAAALDAGGDKGLLLSHQYGITENGRYVAYGGTADTLAVSAGAAQHTVTWEDTWTGMTLKLPYDARTIGAATDTSIQISADGRDVVFADGSRDPGGHNNEIVTWDVQTSQVTRDASGAHGVAHGLSLAASGLPADTWPPGGGAAAQLAISHPVASPVGGGVGALAFAGTEGNDVAIGGAGDDYLYGAGGDDDLNGGGGDDTAGYSGKFSDYQFEGKAGGGLFVADQRTGGTAHSDGRDFLSNIEHLAFADGGAVVLDTGHATATSGTASLLHLYDSAFGRLPDSGGLAYWTAALQQGASVGGVAGAFLASDEFAAKHADLGADVDFVSWLYSSLLHRQAGAGELLYWDTQLQNGVSRGQVMADFAGSSEAQQQIQTETVGWSSNQGLTYTLSHTVVFIHDPLLAAGIPTPGVLPV